VVTNAKRRFGEGIIAGRSGECGDWWLRCDPSRIIREFISGDWWGVRNVPIENPAILMLLSRSSKYTQVLYTRFDISD